MKITNNIIKSNYPITKPKEKQTNQSEIKTFGNNLMSVNTVNSPIIDSSVPVSYNKIGEIEVPGLKDKADVYKLANGQRVVILPKKGPVYIKTSYNVGSLNETEDIRGMSHYIEHNLFNGSKSLKPQEYDKKVKQMGGYSNANTSLNRTNYFLNLQLLKPEFLEEAIKLNALQTQFPSFPPEQLEREKEPVKSEIDVYKDNPFDIADSILHKLLFGIDSQASNLVLGTKDNINSFTKEKVLDYFNTWYTPDNAVTVITGDVDPEETIKLVSKHFNKKNDYSKINQRQYYPLKYIEKTTRTDVISKNSSASSIAMGFVIPENTSKEDLYKLDALISILCAPDSNLSKALDKYGISAEDLIAVNDVQNKPDGAKSLLLCTPLAEKHTEEVLQVIFDELSDIIQNPPSVNAVNNYKKNAVNNINSLSEYSENINSVLSNMMFSNDYNYFNAKKNVINSLTPQDISETAKKFLNLNKTAICVTHAKNTQINSINDNYKKLHTSSNVSFGSNIKNPIDSITEEINQCSQFILPNNIKTTFSQGNQCYKNILSISLKSKELNSYSMPAFLVLNQMLNRGSLLTDNDKYKNFKSSNDIDIIYAVDSNGINILSAFYDNNLQKAVKQIKETLTVPNFSKEEFERAKKIAKDIITNSNDTASSLINSELYKQINSFKTKEENIKAIDNLSYEDIQKLYENILSSAQANVVYTAPVVENPQLINILNSELSQGLPTFKPVDISTLSVYQPNTEAKVITKAEENAQANIIQSYTFKKAENTDDIAKIKLLNAILGEGMSSRLFKDLREKQNLAYHVGSYLKNDLQALHDISRLDFVIETTTDSPDPKEGSPENVNKALNSFERHVNLLKTQMVTEEELQTAKLKLKSAILDSLESNLNKNVFFKSSDNSYYGLNFYKSLFEAIDKINVEDIKNTANYVFANKPVTAIVASKKTLDYLNL